MCNPPTVNDHVTKDCSHGNDYGSVCTFTCDTGYGLVGSNTVTCTGTRSPGNWTNPSPSCQSKPSLSVQRSILMIYANVSVATCPVLKPRPHGRIECSDNQNFKSTCSLKCDEGYELTGLSQVVCQAIGSWSGGLSSCQSMHIVYV